jgi:hypothetical protein
LIIICPWQIVGLVLAIRFSAGTLTSFGWDISAVDGTKVARRKVVCLSNIIVIWGFIHWHALLLQAPSDVCHALVIVSRRYI